MKKSRLVILSTTPDRESLLLCFESNPSVEVVAFIDVPNQEEIFSNVDTKQQVFNQLKDILEKEKPDIIINNANLPEIEENILKYKPLETQVMNSVSVDFVKALCNYKEQAESEIYSIISMINDAVQIIDKHGTIKYINPSFEKTVSIPSEQLVGKNVFELFPECPFSYTLKTGEMVSGQKLTFNNGNKEYNYTISPIITNGEITGAVGVFKLLPDIVKLMEELQRSTSIIEGLYDKLSRIYGMSELDLSEVMPIDKMEQILLRQALTKYGYSVEGKKKAARALNISLATLYNKLKKYQIS